MGSSLKIPGFLAGGGEMGDRIRNFEWTSTPLGRPETWEQSLKTCVRIMLTSSQPMWIGWGKDLIKLYNDPYKAIVGGKHPGALGQPASLVWRDIWKDIAPMLKQVMDKDEGTYVESQLLIMERNHYPEETYYTFSYTPIPGDKGGTGGMICANTDDTNRIINERALKTLRDLGKISYLENNVTEIYSKAAEVLAENNKDFPFACIYEIDPKFLQAKLVVCAGFENTHIDLPKIIDVKNPHSDTENFCRAVTTHEVVLSENPRRRSDAPKGFWDVPASQFLHIPLRLSKNTMPTAILSVGLNPFRKYDNVYQQFVRLITDQLTIALNNIEALDAERKRAKALAEIDRAKTVFFNNISHEFRTPLTLMLGPLEEMLLQPKNELNAKNRLNLETTHRNTMRLLKLVNTLLDFSRIESGKQEAKFTLIDVSTYTTSLVSSFRSIIEKAGLSLVVNADTIKQPVYVDKPMWEKIVFNLLSNAFKYTLEGTIEVNLFAAGNEVILQVVDTGVGIPDSELPHMFQRFHRVDGPAGRTYEGTGIGLSMIKELVHLHGGKISVSSKVGTGSTFSVHIPIGCDHLSSQQIAETTIGFDDVISSTFIEEAASLAEDIYQKIPDNQPSKAKKDHKAATILVVDDNADMRQYLHSLINEEYRVITAVNGMDALQKIREFQPTLILSDIMMPVLDGFGLLKEVKQNPETFHIPVILLSARAGEEAKIEGYEVGADDYLVKPFSAKEFLARIKSQLRIVALRTRTEEHLKNLFLKAPVAISILRGPQLVIELINEKMLEIWNRNAKDLLKKPLFGAMPGLRGQGLEEHLYNVVKTGERYLASELPVHVSGNGAIEKIYLSVVYQPLYDEDKNVTAIMVVANDITSSVIARQKIEESERRFRRIADKAPVMIWMTSENGLVTFLNQAWLSFTGYALEEEASNNWTKHIHPDDLQHCLDVCANAHKTRNEFYIEYRLKRSDGQYRWLSSKGVARVSAHGVFEGFIGACMDIQGQKAFASELEKQVKERTEELEEKNSELAQKNKDLQSFAYVSSHDLQEPLRKIQTLSSFLRETENGLSEKGKNYFTRIQEASGKMQMLINDLLAYSRLASEEQVYELTDLAQLVEDLKEDMKEVLIEKNAIIEVDVESNIQVIPFQFRQLLNNLIGNSLKFSKAGLRPHIRLKSEGIVGKTDIAENLIPGIYYWHISIADNGIGFEPEFSSKIFELFQRLHSKSEYPGTGIGLAIVKKIVENHKGYIAAKSELNKGARFDIYIPQTTHVKVS